MQNPALCTDNGAMIAFAGYQALKAGQVMVVGDNDSALADELTNPSEAILSF